MADVVEHTSKLSEEDQEAYAAFFTRGSTAGEGGGDDFNFD